MTFSNEKSWIFKIRWDFNALPEFTPLSYIKQAQKEKETWQKKLFQDTVREVLTECSHSSFIPQIFNWFTYFYMWSTMLGSRRAQWTWTWWRLESSGIVEGLLSRNSKLTLLVHFLGHMKESVRGESLSAKEGKQLLHQILSLPLKKSQYGFKFQTASDTNVLPGIMQSSC